MKKTLCKAIHEHFPYTFLCLEDIIAVRIDKINKGSIFHKDIHYLVTISYKGIKEKCSFIYQNEDKAENFKNSIIKELEEYYGVQRFYKRYETD